MAEIVLFHHVQGLTDGVKAFADLLRSGGNTVHTPDLFEGGLPGSIEDGVALARSIGDDTLNARASDAVADRGPGWCSPVSRWVPASPKVSRRPALGRGGRCSTRRVCRSPASGPSVRGPTASRCRSTVWIKIRSSGSRAISTRRGRSWRRSSRLAELFVYSGDRHLFTDSSLPSFDVDARDLVVERSLAFLDRLS